MLQIIHEDDVLEALAHATLQDVTGVFNIAASDAMPLSRIIALSGKPYLPIVHCLAHWGAGLLGSVGAKLDNYLPIDPDYLRYSWIGDLDKMREELNFVPRYTAEQILSEFATRIHSKPNSGALAADELRLHATIERRRRARDR
jgi:UDP-glucose 4-epimerase